MLNLKTTNIVFISLLIGMIGYHFFYDIPVFIYILLFMAYLGFLFYGSFHVRSDFYLKTLSSVKTSQKQIAITFDDGPIPGYTEKILEILRSSGVKAAFFCIGKRVAAQEALFKRIYEEGHVIGNHSFSHDPWFDFFSSERMTSDLKMMSNAMQKVIGIKPRMFRPPYGVTNPNLKKAIVKNSFFTIGWSVRSLDTVIKKEKKLYKKVTESLKPGAVFLFHDNGKATTNILSDFISYCHEQGYEIVRLDKLLNLEPYE